MTGSGGDQGTGGDVGSGGSGTGGDTGTGGSGGSGTGGDTGSGGSTGTGGSNGGGKGQNFGTHTFQYPSGALHPSGAQTALDSATASFYDTWKSKYLKMASCGGNYVFSGGGTGCSACVTISEGHGYGMVIVPMMAGHDTDAQKLFDGLYQYFRKAPSGITPDLMAWAADANCKPVSGPDSATDGDLDIAFGLLLADKQWGSTGTINYLAEAKKVINAIKSAEVNHTTHLTMLGDWDEQTAYSTRPSDFMIDHFRSFASATGDADWNKTVDATYQVIGTITGPTGPAKTTGLMPDFVVSTNTTAKPANSGFLEGPHDGDYDYNSCRYPWRLGTDYIVSGDAKAKAAAVQLTTWIKGAAKTPDGIRSGYKLSGTAYVDYVDMAFEAPFGVAALGGGDQAWLDAMWTSISGMGAEDYYSDSIKLLSMVVMSGNWWAP
jgi:endo-1,4-beta-D-glucanase Y